MFIPELTSCANISYRIWVLTAVIMPELDGV
jgi:hypothetical protein